jgi:hypothetical protein
MRVKAGKNSRIIIAHFAFMRVKLLKNKKSEFSGRLTPLYPIVRTIRPVVQVGTSYTVLVCNTGNTGHAGSTSGTGGVRSRGRAGLVGRILIGLKHVRCRSRVFCQNIHIRIWLLILSNMIDKMGFYFDKIPISVKIKKYVFFANTA